MLEWALIGVEERLGYFLKNAERQDLLSKREYLIKQINEEKVGSFGKREGV